MKPDALLMRLADVLVAAIWMDIVVFVMTMTIFNLVMDVTIQIPVQITDALKKLD